jgi:transketolase N-terminal domain/subunit
MTATSSPLTTADLATVRQLARQLRVDSIRASTSAGSGHPTSSMSAADLLAVLVARHLQYDWEHPNGHPLYRYSGRRKARWYERPARDGLRRRVVRRLRRGTGRLASRVQAG